MNRFVALAIVVALPLGFARAEEKAGVAGTWTWNVQGTSSNQPITLKLKQDGSKLTGTLNRNGKDTNLEDGKISKDEVSFTVTPARNGAKFPVKYSGKLAGDTITGTMEFTINGEARTAPWKAWRSKE